MLNFLNQAFTSGFLLIDKPRDVTSFFIVKILRKILNIKRIGFVGTLDPLATGLMIFAIGEATKFISCLEGADKVYDAMIHLGAVSDTYDAKGTVIPMKDIVKPSRFQIEKILEEKFSGERQQVPPIFSAIKIGGKRAYDLARNNRLFSIQSRKVYFFEIRIVSYAWPFLRLKIHCSSGTYIRSLAHDLGKILGCGGYIEELRRIVISSWKVQDALSFSSLQIENIHKSLKYPHLFFADWPQIQLNDQEYIHLANGGYIENKLFFPVSQKHSFRVHDKDFMPILALYQNFCVGILNIFDGKLKFQRKLNIVSEA